MSVIADVDICNMALDQLNQVNITGLDENTKTAKKCRQWYDTIRKSLLLNINASFSIARATLPEVVGYSPMNGYEKAYALPKNCLQVLSVGEPVHDELYQIEGEYFYCNYSEKPCIKYIKDVEDVSIMDAEFVQLFALALAEAICVPLTEDIEKRNYLKQLKQEKYLQASTKYGRDNRITVINKPRYREAKSNSEIENSNYYIH